MSNELAAFAAPFSSTAHKINSSAMLAHELNNPIGTISNILLGVKLRLQKENVSIDGIDTALNSALEQVQFSQNVIDTIYASKQVRHKCFCLLDVRQQIYNSIALLQTLLSENDCRLVLQLPKMPVYLHGNATQIQQVLTNLLRNAIEAMPAHAAIDRQIVISVEQCNGRFMLSIADNAQSFQVEHANPFSAISTDVPPSDSTDISFDSSSDASPGPDHTLKLKPKSMGIGLAICRSIVEMHNGQLSFSVAEGVGCICRLDLPVVHTQASVVDKCG